VVTYSTFRNNHICCNFQISFNRNRTTFTARRVTRDASLALNTLKRVCICGRGSAAHILAYLEARKRVWGANSASANPLARYEGHFKAGKERGKGRKGGKGEGRKGMEENKRIAEFARLEFAGLEKWRTKNDRLENNGVEQEQTYILHKISERKLMCTTRKIAVVSSNQLTFVTETETVT